MRVILWAYVYICAPTSGVLCLVDTKPCGFNPELNIGYTYLGGDMLDIVVGLERGVVTMVCRLLNPPIHVHCSSIIACRRFIFY